MLNNIERTLNHYHNRPEVHSLIQKSVFTLVEDLLARPRKEVRGTLTHLGFSLAHEQEQQPNSSETQQLNACGELVELLHAGSLIVDDIQDSSLVRRGDETIHLRYGLPLALNAGNWMYFYALEPIKQLQVAPEKMLKIYQVTQETLLQAHYGQAIDLSTKIHQLSPKQMIEVVQTSLELKTGALMALAIDLGAIIAGTSDQRRKVLHQFGIELGVALQRFDDIGNLKPEKPTPKHLEDLINRRPSYVWSFLAQPENRHLLTLFQKAIETLPDVSQLQQLLKDENLIAKMWQQSWQDFQSVIQTLAKNLDDSMEQPQKFPLALTQVYKLGERIAHAY